MKYISKLLILVSVLVAMSCAEDIGTIDKVQPNYHSKKFFDGEWYHRTTVVDVPYTTAFSFVGSQGDVTLITWDMQEKYLIGYKSYEHNPGSEAYLQKDKTFGTVCEMEKAGEKSLTVIGYNEDCPEGTKLVSKHAFQGTPVVAYRIKKHFDIIRRYNTTTGEQTNVLVEDTQDHEWYDRKFIRVDWSSNLIQDIDFGGLASIPTQPVSFYCSETVDSKDTTCNKWKPEFSEDENGNGTYFSIVGKLLAMPETRNYYGEEYPACYFGIAQDCLGQEITYKDDFYKKLPKYYHTKPVEYDDGKMNKFGFFRTEKYVYDKDRGFLDDAKVYRANVFNIIPRDENGKLIKKDGVVQVNPIVYYVNKDFPEKLMTTARALANGFDKKLYYDQETTVHRDGWNDVFKRVVKRKLGKLKTNHKNMFVVCGNPVSDEDPEICGEKGFSPRVGDLRYNMIVWVNNPQKSSPLGYGPLAADPITGQTISANAFIYGDVLDWYAQYILDLVDLFNGEINVSDYISGRYIAQYFEEQDTRHPKAKTKSFNNLVMGKTFINNNLNIERIAELNEKAEAIRAGIKDGKFRTNHFEKRISRIKGTSIEDALITKDIKALFGASEESIESSSLSDADRDKFSPRKWLSRENLERDDKIRRMMAKKTIMMGDFIEDTLIGTAKELKEMNLSKAEMFDYLLKELFLATTIHELGHNVGLRHNFASHSDALNFFPQYWDIRMEGATAEGVKGRYLEPKSLIASQMEKGITDYQYSSIMDYGGRANSDLQGLGAYDDAAVTFAYVDMIQIFDSSNSLEYIDATKDINLGYAPNIARQNWKNEHYTTLPYTIVKNFGDKSSKEKVIDVLYGHRKWVDYRDVLYDKDNSKVKKNRALYLTDKKKDGLVEVPYAFCSDEYHSGKYKCYRFAIGVDMYESVAHQIDYYNNWYFIRNFWKGSSHGAGRGYYGRLNRTFDFIANQYKHWVNEALIAQSTHAPDLEASVITGFDFFASVLGSVEPGFYKEENGEYVLSRTKDYLNDWDAQPEAGEIEIPLGVGKYQETQYDESLGYSYYHTPIIQGVWLDKIVALFTLGDEHTNYMGIDASGDSASYAISYNTIFLEDINRLLSGILLDKAEYYAPFMFNGEFYKPIASLDAGVKNPGSDAKNFYTTNKDNFKYIKPNNPFIIKLYSAILGLSYYGDINRLDFGKTFDINILGNGDSYEVTENYDDLLPELKNFIEKTAGGEAEARSRWQDALIVVNDPMTHKTYYSLNVYAFENTTLPRVSVGYELLKDYKVAIDAYDVAKAGGDNDTFVAAREALKEKRNFLDWIVNLLHYYENPRW